MEVVRATPGHREFVRALSVEVFARFGDYGASLSETMALPWVRTLVAEAERKPVGFAMYSLEEIGAGEIDLVAIAVAPAWQSRGIGRRLLAHVERASGRLALEADVSIRLAVAEDNTPARTLFEKAGYVLVAGAEGVYPRGQRSLTLRKRIGRSAFPD